MATKLTLSIEKETIDAAKKYARKKNTSLSDLIENYLVSITRKNTLIEPDISPLVKSLSGVLELDSTSDFNKSYPEYLAKKYQ